MEVKEQQLETSQTVSSQSNKKERQELDPVRVALEKIRINSQNRIQKIERLASIATDSVTEQEIAVEEKDEPAVNKNPEKMLREQTIEIHKNRQEIDRLEQEQEKFKMEYTSLSEQLEDVQKQIESSSKEGLIRRTLSRGRMSRLKKQEIALNASIDSLQENGSSKHYEYSKKIRAIESEIKHLKYQRVETLGDIVAQEMVDSLPDYAELVDASTNDKQLDADIHENYLTDTIEPDIRKTYSGQLSPEEIDTFVDMLRKDLVLKENITELLRKNPEIFPHLLELDTLLRPLKKESISEPIINTVASMVRREIEEIYETLLNSVKSGVNRYAITDKLSQIGKSEQTTTEKLAQKVIAPRIKHKMEIWKSFSKSARAPNIWRKYIQHRLANL